MKIFFFVLWFRKVKVMYLKMIIIKLIRWKIFYMIDEKFFDGKRDFLIWFVINEEIVLLRFLLYWLLFFKFVIFCVGYWWWYENLVIFLIVGYLCIWMCLYWYYIIWSMFLICWLYLLVVVILDCIWEKYDYSLLDIFVCVGFRFDVLYD